MPSPTKVTLNDQIFKISEIVEALQLLSAEFQKKRETFLTEESMVEIITKTLTTKEDIFASLCSKIATNIGHSSIIRGISSEVRQEFQQHIDEYLKQQLSAPFMEERMAKLIAHIAGGGTFDTINPNPEPQDPKLIPLDSLENISLVMRLLAGPDAIE